LPRHGGLLSDVRKRLSAIKQYSTLGSGFKIAMRDLEIRGAGNLLGSEQSGHITAVGFELYCQLLKQSVAAVKGEKVKPRVEVQVRLDFISYEPSGESARTTQEPALAKPTGHPSAQKARPHPGPLPQEREEVSTGSWPLGARPGSAAVPGPESRKGRGRRMAGGTAPEDALIAGPASACIPLRYISDPRQRIEIYRKLAQATLRSHLDGLEKEMRDRFGPMPSALALLIRATELRILAADRGITAIEVKEDRLMLTRNNDFIMIGSKFPRLTGRDAGSRVAEIKRLLLAL